MIADFGPLERRRQQNAWNWYDWANSAFYTTVLAAIFGPYMVTVAGRAAGCVDLDDTCTRTVSVLGLDLAAGALPSYLTSFATITSALLLPIVGVLVDRSSRKKWHLAGYAWGGSLCTALLFTMKGDNWEIAAVAIVLASILGGCSLVAYYAILVDISTVAERDVASARGWAWGFVGGGILLAVNLVMVSAPGLFGLDTESAARFSLLSAGIWWAVFTIVPVAKLRNYPATLPDGGLPERRRQVLWSSFGELARTLREIRKYPMTLTFLVAYIFYNDGIQTVINSAATYGAKQLGLSTSVLLATILMIQFVAVGGALGFGRLATSHGSYRAIKYGVWAWMGVVAAAAFLPRGNVGAFVALGFVLALVMGGTQALSRSFFSLLIPPGREGAYFALYGAAERGTSWIGTLTFGLVFQLTGSYRPAIGAIIAFFVIGTIVLSRLDPERGIRDAGHEVPWEGRSGGLPFRRR